MCQFQPRTQLEAVPVWMTLVADMSNRFFPNVGGCGESISHVPVFLCAWYCFQSHGGLVPT